MNRWTVPVARRAGPEKPRASTCPASRWTAVVLMVSSACVTSGATAERVHVEPELVASAVRHRIGPGETLYRIARTYGTSVDEIARANGIGDPSRITLGAELIIPAATPPEPSRRIAELTIPSAGPPEPAGPIPKVTAPPAPPLVNPRSSPNGENAVSARRRFDRHDGEGNLAWPLRGVLYARFGTKGTERHDGIDLAAPSGTPIRTARPGTVLYAGEQKGYGLIAIVDHGGGLTTLYAHCRDLRVKSGQRVRDGQVIATVGESGRTSGPHLHFEVRKDAVPVDPLRYLGSPPDSENVSRF